MVHNMSSIAAAVRSPPMASESVPALDDIGGYLSFLDDVLDVFPKGRRS